MVPNHQILLFMFSPPKKHTRRCCLWSLNPQTVVVAHWRKQSLWAAAARACTPPQPPPHITSTLSPSTTLPVVPPCAPPTAWVTFALCSSCRVFWKGHLQLLAAFWHRGEWAMWREAAATGQKGPLARFLSTYRFFPFLVRLQLLERGDICTLVVSRWAWLGLGVIVLKYNFFLIWFLKHLLIRRLIYITAV